MAITTNCSKFLFYARSLGVDFTHTLTLGRLNLYASRKDIEEEATRYFGNPGTIAGKDFRSGYSEPLFEVLGAKSVDSMDFSEYEKATILHDLNQPIPAGLKNRFTAIIDGGTIEHVFNFPVAIKNCMEALRVGGHYIAITPANNTMGHGFYQFSPELFYTVFSGANGFAVTKMIIYTQDENGKISDWYEVTDPARAGSRVTLVNSRPTYLMLVAEKKAELPVFASAPQQSDYQVIWAASKSLEENKVPANESRLRFFFRKLTPRFLRIFLRNLHDMFTREKLKDENLGEANAAHFRKIEINK